MYAIPKLLLNSSVLFFCFLTVSANAQANLSLRQAMERALVKNAQVAAAQGRVEDARALKVQAGLKPNPRLTLQTEDIRASTSHLPFSFVNSTEDYVTVGQVIESGGKRERRVDVANAVIKSTQLDQTLTRLQIEARVSSAYWAAVGASRNRQLQEETLRTFEEDVTYTRNRVREGVTAEADLVRIELERDRVRAELLNAKRLASQAMVGLYRAMGATDFTPVNLSEPLETTDSIRKPALEIAMQVRPELQLARQAVVEAEQNVRLQKADGKPDPEALIGYKRNVGYDTFYGALQIDLPLRNRNQGNILSAQAKLRVAKDGLQGEEAMVRADVQAAQLAYDDQQELLKNLPNTLSRAEEAERFTRAAYREGAIDLVRLLDVERSRIQTQADYFRALTELRQSMINLRVAAGEDLLDGERP